MDSGHNGLPHLVTLQAPTFWYAHMSEQLL
jgi:hypothetical protein